MTDPKDSQKSDDELPSGAAAVQIASTAEPRAPEPEPDAQAAFKAFQMGQLAMDRSDFQEALGCFTEAVEADWTQPMYAEWLEEASNRILELEGDDPVEAVEDEETAPPPMLEMPATTLAPPGGSKPPRPPAAPPPPRPSADPEARKAMLATLAERHLKLGLKAQQVGNADEALRNLESAARLAPDDERIARALRNATAQFSKEEVDDGLTTGMRMAADDMRKRNAERYYLRGLKAQRMDMWDEAIACFEGAVRISPDNKDYVAALDEVKAKQEAQLSKAPKGKKKGADAPVPGILESLKDQLLADSRLVMMVVGLVLVGGLFSIWSLIPDSEDTPAEIDLVMELGIFESLEEVEGVGWRASIDEPLLELDTKERNRRCRELAGVLPGGGSLFLTSVEDGSSVMCRAD